MSRVAPEGGPRSHRRLLALILLAGLALRVVYAVYEPTISRFEDERHALKNVVGIVNGGTLEPVSIYYPSPVFTLPPSALVEASNALHRLTGDPRLLTIDEQGISHTATFLIVRLLMAAYGTLAVYVIFLVGRRMFSSGVGLLAAAMLAFMPWMVHSSGSFKPDPLLVLLVLFAFWASLRAVDERRLAPYFLAGLAIALAASAKLTGLLVALPLTVATAMLWRDRRRWALLVAAGAISFLSFILLNPWWWAYPRFIEGLSRDYAMRAGWLRMTRAQMPERVLDLMLGESGHGPWLGAMAIVGLLGLVVRASRPSTERGERVRLGMLLVFPPAYVAAYTARTPFFKSNNFLPVLAFTTLACAWALAAAWHWAGQRWPVLASRGARLPVMAALALLLSSPGIGYVHASLTPSTEDLVRQLLRHRLGPPAGRSVVLEPEARRGSIWEGAVRFRVAEIAVDRLDELAPRELNMADAEVFAERRLRGANAEFYRRRMERLAPDLVHTFRPDLPGLRGPALVALIHRRTPLAEPRKLVVERCAAAPTCFEARLPAEMVPRERFSLQLGVPLVLAPTPGTAPPVEVAGRSIDLIEVVRGVPWVHAGTARLHVDDPGGAVIRFTAEQSSRRPVTIWLMRWAGGPRAAPPARAR